MKKTIVFMLVFAILVVFLAACETEEEKLMRELEAEIAAAEVNLKATEADYQAARAATERAVSDAYTSSPIGIADDADYVTWETAVNAAYANAAFVDEATFKTAIADANAAYKAAIAATNRALEAGD
jgi:uncharacterized lipoprotein YehR (DUF1307 family)